MNPGLLRLCLATLASTCSLLAMPAFATKVPTDVMTILYTKETPEAPNRLDSTVQAATRAIEQELRGKGYKVPRTPPKVLEAMDRSPNVIVSFAPDAGFSLFFSVYKNLRPDAGINVAAAEVSISARVYVGSGLLATEEGRAVIRTRVDDKLKEFGERRAMEIAAQKAAARLMEAVDGDLKRLTQEEIDAYLAMNVVEDTQIDDIAPPPAATPPHVNAPAQPAPSADVVPTQPDVIIPAQAPAVASPSGTSPLAPAARRYAVVIGVGDYSYVDRLNNIPESSSLPGVATDVQNMANLFRKLGFKPEDVTTLLNADATAANVLAALNTVARKAGPKDLIAVYISGHGMPVKWKPRGMSRPVLYDFSFSHAADAPDFERLMEIIAQSQNQGVVMIIDTCHSGGASSILPTVVEASYRGIDFSPATGGPSARGLVRALPAERNIAVLAAAKANESSFDQGVQNGGLFTKYLVQGLIEAAGQEPLRTTVENRVAGPVIRVSKKICEQIAQRGKSCPTGQQTPTLGFAGKGEEIRF